MISLILYIIIALLISALVSTYYFSDPKKDHKRINKK